MRTFGRALAATLLLTTAPVLHAQSGQATEFWKAVGRYTDGTKPDVPNISGKYELQGSFEDNKWSGKVEVKRIETKQAPQGNKFNIYRVTWIWDDGKQPGVAMLLGKRLYAAYGSENLALHVLAPFKLEDAEKPGWNKDAEVFAEYESKGGGGGKVWVRNPPWFHVAVANNIRPPAYYDLWVTPKGYYGHQFVRPRQEGPMTAFAEGDYAVSGNLLDDDGELEYTNGPTGKWLRSSFFFWRLVPNGANFSVRQRSKPGNFDKDASMDEEDDLDGQAMVLEDGTVASVIGGNDGVRVMAFDVKDGKFVGQRTDFGTDGRAAETWTPEAGIVSKNARLFSP